MNCSRPGFSVLHRLPELAQTHAHWVSDAIQPPHLLLSPSPPSFSLSQDQGLISNELALHIRWSKYWSCSFSISPSDEYSELIPCRTDWFDFLTVQGTLKESSPTPHFKGTNSLAFSLLYAPTLTSITTTRKIIALTTWTSVGKVTSLFFNTLSRFVIAFILRRKYLLILWIQSPSAMILDPRK